MTAEESPLSGGGQEHEETQEKPLIEVLVDSALERFNSRRSFIGRFNLTMPYGCLSAAEDAVKNLGKDADELFLSLSSQTTITPRDLMGDVGFGQLNMAIAMGDIDNWDDVKNKLSSMIIQQELERRHPKVVREDRDRGREFGLFRKL